MNKVATLMCFIQKAENIHQEWMKEEITYQEYINKTMELADEWGIIITKKKGYSNE